MGVIVMQLRTFKKFCIWRKALHGKRGASQGCLCLRCPGNLGASLISLTFLRQPGLLVNRRFSSQGRWPRFFF